MSDPSKTYSSLVVQPIDLINAFKLDFVLASVIKWMTQWHMQNKSEYIQKVSYYVGLCQDTVPNKPLMFALRMYCIVNGFMTSESRSCLLLDVMEHVLNGDLNKAQLRLCSRSND